MDRSSKLLLRKIIIDFLCIFVVGISVLSFFLYGKPFKRGFFCNDESLYHPFSPSTVSSTMLYFVGMVLPICVMIVGEFFHLRSAGDSSKALFGYIIPHWICSAYAKVGIFAFGAGVTVLTTDIAKYTVGRLRPHFMDLCKPNVDCTLARNQHVYIEDFTCTATNFSEHLLKNVRLSFPSGHSSFSAYTMIFLALYLQLRITWKGSNLLRHVLQFACLVMAWFTALTRVSNYKHHWSDVLAGSTLGTIVALVMVFCISDFFKEKSNRYIGEKNARSTDYEAGAMGTQVNNGTANCDC